MMLAFAAATAAGVALVIGGEIGRSVLAAL